MTQQNQLSYQWKWVGSAIEDVAKSGIFNEPMHSLFEPSFTRVMINLNEILQAMSKTDNPGRVTTPIVAEQIVEVGDITDLVNLFRSGLCHLNTPRKRWPKLQEGEVFGGWFVQTASAATTVIGGYRQPAVPAGDCMIGIGPFRMLLNADLAPVVDTALAWTRLGIPRS